MSVVSKIDRHGVDIVIENLQQSLFPRLIKFWDVNAEYTSYPRANKNKRDGDLLPEVSLNKNEYKEVFMDDNVAVNSFWLVNNTRPYGTNQRQFEHEVSLIFQADLVKLYGQTNRADEEFNMNVIAELEKPNPYMFETDIEIIETVDLVYTDLTISPGMKDKIDLDDISSLHVVRFDFTVKYNIDCNIPTIPPVCLSVRETFNGDIISPIPSGGVKNIIVQTNDTVPVQIGTIITDTPSLLVIEIDSQQPQAIGDILDIDFSTLANLDDFTTSFDGTTTAVLDAGVLKISGTPATLLPVDNVIFNNYITGLENFVFSFDFIIKTNTNANEGVAIGFQADTASIPLPLRRDVYYHFRNTSSGLTGQTFRQFNSVTPTMFLSAIAPVIDDEYRFTMTKVSNEFTIKLENLTNPNSTDASITYTYANTTGDLMNSSSNLGIYHVGGEHWIKNFKLSSTDLKDVDHIVIGDSMTQGYCSTILSDRWLDEVKSANPSLSFTKSAAQNDGPDTAVNKNDELVLINGSNAILFIGTNQITQEGSTAALASYATMYTNLQAAGVTSFIHLNALPRLGDTDINVFNSQLAITYASDIVVDLNVIFNDGSDSLLAIYDCGDAVHPNDAGQTVISDAVNAVL